MKILIICHEFPPIGGGAANAAFYIASYLKDKQHEVTMVTSRFKQVNQSEYDFNIVYLPVLRKHIDRTSPLELISFTISGIIYGLKTVRKKKYDICLAIHGIPSGWVAFVMYKLFKIPYVVSLQGGDVPGFLPQEYDELHKKVKILTRLYWRDAKSIIANSEGLKELADITADTLDKNVRVISNGVDCQAFKPDHSLRNEQSIRILYAGRLTLQKGLECFIESVKQAKDKIKNNFNIKIIGNGYLKDHLKKTSSELCSSGIVTFSDWMDKEDLVSEYKKAHIFILPSFYEGMSNSLLEAMACGCMVIASDIPGNRGLVKKSENGFLFCPDNVLELEGILTSVLNSRLDMIEDMGKKSRIIAERFDWGKVTDSYLKEFYA
jgi:glycosyltransferase involved in cell wall biosynthesis